MSGLKDTTATSTTDANQINRSGSGDVGHKRGSGDLFSGMKEYKRDPENAAGQARRESLKDMSEKPGMLANMWNNTFKGADSK